MPIVSQLIINCSSIKEKKNLQTLTWNIIPSAGSNKKITPTETILLFYNGHWIMGYLTI